MADIDRDYPARERVERERIYATGSGGNAGWWIAGILIVALLVIGFFAMNTGNPPTTPAATAPGAPGAEMTQPAPMEPAAPMAPVEPAAPVAPAPATPAPAN